MEPMRDIRRALLEADVSEIGNSWDFQFSVGNNVLITWLVSVDR